MTNTKVTRKSALEYVLANYELPAEIAEKLDSMVAAEVKKASAIRKPTPNQVENKSIKSALFELMEIGVRYRAMELAKLYNESHGANISGQRVSALLRQMKLDGDVSKVEEKRISYFVREV